MQSNLHLTPFVAVGGLGGSGTRVVAQILQKMGYYLGPVLNPQLDNLLFTLLFKRRDWFETFPTDAEIDRMIGIFSAAMCKGVDQAFERLATEEVEQLKEKARGFGINRDNFEAILTSRPPDLNLFSGLAWKEPNTHVFLPQLAQRFPNMKYIHVLRHGLDMALSRNHQQLTNWGGHYGIRADTEDSPTKAQLQFWLAANHRVIEIGKRLGTERFLLLNYDELCLNFESEVDTLQTFLGRQLSDVDRTFFISHVGSNSIGRFRKASASVFSPAEREAVQHLGFCVD